MWVIMERASCHWPGCPHSLQDSASIVPHFVRSIFFSIHRSPYHSTLYSLREAYCDSVVKYIEVNLLRLVRCARAGCVRAGRIITYWNVMFLFFLVRHQKFPA